MYSSTSSLLRALLGCAALAPASLWSAQSTALPPARVVPVLPANTVPNGPPIPTTDPAEPAHPASIPLWVNGAPGFESRKDEPEQISWRQEIDIVFPVLFNVNNPTITPYLPAKDKATGCAVIIAPGGGFMFHTIGREGYDLGQWLADHGIAAFVLKYRLARDQAYPANAPQPYQTNVHALADAQRAMRLVRSRAPEWGLDPQHIGMIGFSAGGGVLGELLDADDKGNPEATDPLDRLDAHPNFAAFGYSSGTRGWATATWVPPANMPPTFLVCAANDRPNISELYATFYLDLKRAQVPVEMHVFGDGGHGFGVRPWSYSVAGWPNLFVGWLNDRGFLAKAK